MNDGIEQLEVHKELEIYHAALHAYRKAGRRDKEAIVLNNMVMAHHSLRDFSNALKSGQQSLHIAQEMGLSTFEANVLCTLGDVHLGRGDYAQALNHFRQSLDLAQETGFRHLVVHALLGTGRAAVEQRDAKSALPALHRAASIAQEIEARTELAECHRLLTEAYKLKGDFGVAQYHCEKFHRIRETIFNEEADRRLQNLQIIHDTKTAKKQAEALRLRNVALEHRIAAMFESVTDGIVFTDLQGNVIEANEAVLRMHGYRRKEEIIGQNALEFLAQDDRPGVQESLTEALKRGKRGVIECKLVTRDGAILDAEVSTALLRDEQGNPTGYVALARDVSARRHKEQERTSLLTQVREQAQRVQQILDTVPEGVLLLDGNSRVIQANPLGERDLIILAEAKVGDTLSHLGDLSLTELFVLSPGEPWHETTAGGQTYQVIARPIETSSEEEGERGDWVLVIRNVTGERELQRRVQRQDRLAVIGQLAGGVAHDFNNVLTAIQGFTGLVLDGLAPDDPIRADLEEVTRAADRAAALTGQLLIFGRKQALQPQALDLGEAISNLEQMLHRLIGEDIELSKALSPTLGRVMADPGQIEQVIMNLVVNARDAMPQGGQLVLETGNVELDETYTRLHPGVEPGAYVVLAVSDTGVGMTAEVRSHIFEPYFTTKEKGRGTGLGLSTVHGIVAQSRGHIEVYSEPGMGTTFKVYLPQVDACGEPVKEERACDAPPRGTETVLLAEDDDVIREMARRGLEHYGYTVLEARCPSQAIDVSDQHDGPIHLLVTDVVLPEKGGRELAEELVAAHPEMKVLYTSGYTDDAIIRHGVLVAGQAFLEKPFTLTALAHHVREVLDKATS